MNPNKDIVLYTDYRKFLRDYYRYRKENSSSFSYRLFAEMAGFSSVSFLKMVLDEERNITNKSINQISNALKLNKKNTVYFEHIVKFTQSKTFDQKMEALKKIHQFRKKNKPELIQPEELDYLTHWLHPIIREMVELPQFEENLLKIAQRIHFSVTLDDVKNSLNFLEKHGFLKRDIMNNLHKKKKTLATKTIATDLEFSLIAQKYHLKILELAAQAIADFPRDKRFVVSSTLSMSQKNFSIACKRIESLFFELLELAEKDDTVEQIYLLNVNFFPTLKDTSDD